MSWQLYLTAILVSLFFIFFIIELVRRGALREQYSLLWLGLGLVMLILSASKRLLFVLADWFGVVYHPSLLFLFGLICAFALLLHVTVALSRQADKVIRLTQELAITQHRLHEIEAKFGMADSSTRTMQRMEPESPDEDHPLNGMLRDSAQRAESVEGNTV